MNRSVSAMVDSVMNQASENDSQVHHMPKKVPGFDGTPADGPGRKKTRASYERAGYFGTFPDFLGLPYC
jgi:hypothetical protein